MLILKISLGEIRGKTFKLPLIYFMSNLYKSVKQLVIYMEIDLSDSCLTEKEQFFSYIVVKNTIPFDESMILFVLNGHGIVLSH